MALDKSWLSRRVGARPTMRGRPQQTQRPSALDKAQTEQRALLRAAKAARQQRMARAALDHPSFARFMRSLPAIEKMADAPYPGVIDVDLVELIQTLNLQSLPPETRFLVVEECHALAKRVTKRAFGCPDAFTIAPWDMAARGVKFTHIEVREALGLR